MATIIDVAKYVGVSKSTVSRVINDNGYVDAGTREKIITAMTALDYTPSSFAQNIRTQKSKTIAMMIPDASNTFYMEMFKVVEDVALEYDYMVVICDTRLSYENEIVYADKLLKRHIDGLLYFTQQKTDKNEEFFVSLSKKMPIVFMDYAFSGIEGLSCVAMESSRCTSDAVRFLYGKGRRRIAYINLPKDKNVTLIRCEGYKLGLKECGLDYDPELVILPHSERSHSLVNVGYYAARELLSKNIKIDAIMAASDHLAVGAVKYLKRSGIKIPEQIGVMGFDDIDLCTTLDPMLTTIRQPIEQMGKDAAHILLNKIFDKPVEREKIIYNGKIVERQST